MDRTIGMDVLAASCTIAVVGPSGRKLGSQVVETNGQAVVEAIRTIPKPRHVCMEEGTQSAWLYEVLSPHVQELVVAGITGSRGPESDARDVVRTQNRLESLYWSRGVAVPGKRVYSASGREELLTKLPVPARTSVARGGSEGAVDNARQPRHPRFDRQATEIVYIIPNLRSRPGAR